MNRSSQIRDSISKYATFAIILAVVATGFFFLGGRLATMPQAAGSVDDESSPVRFRDGMIEVDIDPGDGVGTLSMTSAELVTLITSMTEPSEASELLPARAGGDSDARRTATFTQPSMVDARTYDVAMEEDRLVHFTSLGISGPETVSVPYDIVMFASEQQKGLFYSDFNIFSLFLDPESGIARWSFVYTQTFWQLVVYISLALLVGIAIAARRLRGQRNRLVDENRRMMMARETEREHLAAQIHDGPIQDAQLIVREFGEPRSGVRAGDRPAHRELEGAVDQLVNRLRDICAELRPPVLYHFGLADAIRCRAAEYEERFPGIRFETYLQNVGHLPDDIRLGLFRIAQEAMGNAVKHAEATEISVRLFADDDRISMCVEDDGVGFVAHPERAMSNKHQGMSLISHLANAIDADVDVASEPGTGTRVVVDAPLPKSSTRKELVAAGVPA